MKTKSTQIVIHESFIRVDKDGRTFARASRLSNGKWWAVVNQPIVDGSEVSHEMAVKMMEAAALTVVMSQL